MRKVILIIFLLVLFSFSLGFLLSRLVNEDRTEREEFAGFSVETRAVCEELKEPDCYYRCHDEVFLIIREKETSIYKSDEYVCHEEGWVDPRVKE
jgi:hypothetical protein